MPSTIRLHRVLRAAPERVYRAFLDPDAMVKWLPPNGFTAKVHHISMLESVDPTKCRSQTSQQGRATRSVGNITNWRLKNEFVTPTSSMIRIYPARCR